MSSNNNVIPMPMQQASTQRGGAEEFVYNVESTIWRWLALFAGIVLMIVVIAILLWLLRKSVKSIKHKENEKVYHIERETAFGPRNITVEEHDGY